MADSPRAGEVADQCPTCGCPNFCAEGTLERVTAERDRLRAALHDAHDRLNDHFGHADAPYTPWVLELLAEMKDAFDGR